MCGQEGRGFCGGGRSGRPCAVKLFGKTHDIRSQKTGCKLKRASLLGESVGHQAGRGHPQDDKGDLAVSLAATWVIKVGELGLGPQGVEVVPGDLGIFLHCRVDVSEGFYGMASPTKFLVDKVQALDPLPGP